MDWFLYDNSFRHERVKDIISHDRSDFKKSFYLWMLAMIEPIRYSLTTVRKKPPIPEIKDPKTRISKTSTVKTSTSTPKNQGPKNRDQNPKNQDPKNRNSKSATHRCL